MVENIRSKTFKLKCALIYERLRQFTRMITSHVLGKIHTLKDIRWEHTTKEEICNITCGPIEVGRA